MSITLDELAERETGVAVVEANPTEVLGVLDTRAQAELGLSGEEFLERLRTGAFADCDDAAVERLIGITGLLG